MKTAFIYSDRFGEFSYGASHPMRPVRLRLTHELITALGMETPPGAGVVEARRAADEEILLFHRPEYLRVLKEADSGVCPPDGALFGLGYGDNPVFPGVFEWSSYSTGASVQAADLVEGGSVKTAFNIAGGLHHAMPSRASGFCYINDPAVAIKVLAGRGRRVAYVDIDAHHGDGVQAAFYGSKEVLTISLHESGRWLFPGTGSLEETGTGEGEGFSVNLPLPPETGDAAYLRAFDAVVPVLLDAFKPDIIVTQLGVDTFATDPITHLALTTNSFEEMVRRFRSFNLPWVALGGGGYHLGNVARAWTLAWAVMSGVEVPEEMPEGFFLKHRDIFASKSLRDLPQKEDTLTGGGREGIERGIRFIRERLLPVIKRG